MTDDFVKIARLFNEVELCALEDAVTLLMKVRGDEDLEPLLVKIRTARGWRHQTGRTDRR